MTIPLQARSATRASALQSRWRQARRIRLAACFALMAMSALVWNSFGLFLVAMELEFDASRAAVSSAYGLFALTNALSAPLIGIAMARWGSRPVLVALSLLMGISIAGTALSQSVGSVWLTYGLLGGVGSHGFSTYAVFTVMMRRFRDRPATAMAIADAGSGLSAFLSLPVLEYMIADIGWRWTYGAIAIAMPLVGVVLHGLVLDPVRPTDDRTGIGGLKLRVSPAFLVLALCYFTGSAAYQGLLTHQIALLANYGVSLDRAALIAAWGGLMVFLWRLLSGWLCDRWSLAGVMGLAAVAACVTFVALSIVITGAAATNAAYWVYPVGLSVAFGGTQVLLAVATLRMSTPQTYGVVLGIGRLASGLGMAAGPILTGVAFDLTGGYGLSAVGLSLASAAHFAGFAIASRRFGRSPR